jgi:hypothetical protein
MQVNVDAYVINQKVTKLLVEKYRFKKESAEVIALDIEIILERNDGE